MHASVALSLLPHGGDLGSEACALPSRHAHRRAIPKGLEPISRVMMTAVGSRNPWESGLTRRYREGQPGLLGAIVGRAEAQTIRLALLYALLDGKR